MNYVSRFIAWVESGYAGFKGFLVAMLVYWPPFPFFWEDYVTMVPAYYFFGWVGLGYLLTGIFWLVFYLNKTEAEKAGERRGSFLVGVQLSFFLVPAWPIVLFVSTILGSMVLAIMIAVIVLVLIGSYLQKRFGPSRIS